MHDLFISAFASASQIQPSRPPRVGRRYGLSSLVPTSRFIEFPVVCRSCPVWSCLRLRLCACAVIVCLYACVYCGKGAGKQWRVTALWSQHSVASRPRACRKSVCDSLDDHDSTQIAGQRDWQNTRAHARTHTQLTHNSHTTHTHRHCSQRNGPAKLGKARQLFEWRQIEKGLRKRVVTRCYSLNALKRRPSWCHDAASTQCVCVPILRQFFISPQIHCLSLARTLQQQAGKAWLMLPSFANKRHIIAVNGFICDDKSALTCTSQWCCLMPDKPRKYPEMHVCTLNSFT